MRYVVLLSFLATGCNQLVPFGATAVADAPGADLPAADLPAADLPAADLPAADAPVDAVPRPDTGLPDAGPPDATTTADAPAPLVFTQARVFAGAGGKGLKDGPAADAKFNAPAGIAVAPGGAVYVTEEAGGCRIRKIEAGQVSTIAGGICGYQDGPAAKAQFQEPSGLAVDAAGRLYVADFGSHTIRLIDGGEVSTLAGKPYDPGGADGPASTATFSNPHEVALGPDDALYIAEYEGNRVRRLYQGAVTTIAGTGVEGEADGPALKAKFAAAADVAVDGAGVVYVADFHNAAIRRVAGGVVTTIAATPSDLVNPSCLVLAPGGVLLIGDHGAGAVFALDGQTLTPIAGLAGGLPAAMVQPHSIALRDGKVYVTDYGAHVVWIIEP